MPLLYISVPDENRAVLIRAIRRLNPDDVEVVEGAAESADLALRTADDMDPDGAAGRVGQLLDAANELAGRQLGAIATGEVGWGDPPTRI